MPAQVTIITCPACGAETDLWTGGEDTRCEACDQELYRKQRKDH
jgi:DNA-directed RNA polymerase subunit RPC12/RpoP